MCVENVHVEISQIKAMSWFSNGGLIPVRSVQKLLLLKGRVFIHLLWSVGILVIVAGGIRSFRTIESIDVNSGDRKCVRRIFGIEVSETVSTTRFSVAARTAGFSPSIPPEWRISSVRDVNGHGEDYIYGRALHQLDQLYLEWALRNDPPPVRVQQASDALLAIARCEE